MNREDQDHAWPFGALKTLNNALSLFCLSLVSFNLLFFEITSSIFSPDSSGWFRLLYAFVKV